MGWYTICNDGCEPASGESTIHRARVRSWTRGQMHCTNVSCGVGLGILLLPLLICVGETPCQDRGGQINEAQQGTAYLPVCPHPRGHGPRLHSECRPRRLPDALKPVT